jgi:hypothetical protein
MAEQPTCIVCGAPATRVIDNHGDLPDEVYWLWMTEEVDAPFHLCEEHGEGHAKVIWRIRL